MNVMTFKYFGISIIMIDRTVYFIYLFISAFAGLDLCVWTDILQILSANFVYALLQIV